MIDIPLIVESATLIAFGFLFLIGGFFAKNKILRFFAFFGIFFLLKAVLLLQDFFYGLYFYIWYFFIIMIFVRFFVVFRRGHFR
jgi:hypothetical protein